MFQKNTLTWDAHQKSALLKQNAIGNTPQLLRLDQPLLPQIWNDNFSKRFYLEQVHHRIFTNVMVPPPSSVIS